MMDDSGSAGGMAWSIIPEELFPGINVPPVPLDDAVTGAARGFVRGLSIEVVARAAADGRSGEQTCGPVDEDTSVVASPPATESQFLGRRLLLPVVEGQNDHFPFVVSQSSVRSHLEGSLASERSYAASAMNHGLDIHALDCQNQSREHRPGEVAAHYPGEVAAHYPGEVAPAINLHRTTKPASLNVVSNAVDGPSGNSHSASSDVHSASSDFQRIDESSGNSHSASSDLHSAFSVFQRRPLTVTNNVWGGSIIDLDAVATSAVAASAATANAATTSAVATSAVAVSSTLPSRKDKNSSKDKKRARKSGQDDDDDDHAAKSPKLVKSADDASEKAIKQKKVKQKKVKQEVYPTVLDSMDVHSCTIMGKPYKFRTIEVVQADTGETVRVVQAQDLFHPWRNRRKNVPRSVKIYPTPRLQVMTQVPSFPSTEAVAAADESSSASGQMSSASGQESYVLTRAGVLRILSDGFFSIATDAKCKEMEELLLRLNLRRYIMQYLIPELQDWQPGFQSS